MHKKIKGLEEEVKKCNKLLFEKDKKIEKLQVSADYDFLTGLYNRHGFVREAEKFLDEVSFSSHKRKEGRRFPIRNFSIIFVDLDDLKKFNDLYGHKAGDKFIKIAGEVFKNSIREFDIVSRWGGDEFIIGLVGAFEDEAYKIALKIKRKLEKAKIVGIKGKYKLTASFGVIAAISKNRKKEISKLNELVEKADKAMYKAKRTHGKNFVMVL